MHFYTNIAYAKKLEVADFFPPRFTNFTMVLNDFVSLFNMYSFIQLN